MKINMSTKQETVLQQIREDIGKKHEVVEFKHQMHIGGMLEVCFITRRFSMQFKHKWLVNKLGEISRQKMRVAALKGESNNGNI